MNENNENLKVDPIDQIDGEALKAEFENLMSGSPNMARLMHEVSLHLSDTIMSKDSDGYNAYAMFCSLFGMDMAED